MSVSILPDRERRHLLQFYFAPRLTYGMRLGVASVLIIGGLVIQLLWRPTSIAPLLFVSAPLLIIGNLFLLLRGYDLRPTYGVQKGKWEKTTRDRFKIACGLEKKIDRWDRTFADVTCFTGIACLILLVAGAAALYMYLMEVFRAPYWAQVFAVDAAVLILPHWITGTRRGWRPVALKQQIEALETAMQEIERYEEPPCQIQPMFEVAGTGEMRTPIGARVFIRFPDGPEDFLGLQFQVALNEVQSTKYPYLYSVLVAKETFGLLDNHFDSIASGVHTLLTVENNVEEDIEVIIIRQWARGGTGYHTKPKDVRRIAQTAWIAATNAVQSAPT
ncbi:MAG: hypothetical protein JSV03_05715 [Planctomycetota bacterium]|nr:MAG: hypothetical protein JSV03_05715 [Planctomycetota bacterium]